MVAERTVGRRRASPPDLIVLDTLGKLEEHGHGTGGYCLDCRRLFDVSPTVLILERGRDYSPIGMTPLRCPGCGERRTQYSIISPSKAGFNPSSADKVP
jgi:hypothetical protein